MLRRISRTESTMANRPLVRSADSFNSPSRSLLNTLSPACATDSSFPNARKPHVPLMVWIQRNTEANKP